MLVNMKCIFDLVLPHGKFSALSWKENFEKATALILSLINEKTSNLEKIPGLLNVLKSKAKVVQSVLKLTDVSDMGIPMDLGWINGSKRSFTTI